MTKVYPWRFNHTLNSENRNTSCLFLGGWYTGILIRCGPQLPTPPSIGAHLSTLFELLFFQWISPDSTTEKTENCRESQSLSKFFSTNLDSQLCNSNNPLKYLTRPLTMWSIRKLKRDLWQRDCIGGFGVLVSHLVQQFSPLSHRPWKGGNKILSQMWKTQLKIYSLMWAAKKM